MANWVDKHQDGTRRKQKKRVLIQESRERLTRPRTQSACWKKEMGRRQNEQRPWYQKGKAARTPLKNSN